MSHASLYIFQNSVGGLSGLLPRVVLLVLCALCGLKLSSDVYPQHNIFTPVSVFAPSTTFNKLEEGALLSYDLLYYVISFRYGII